MTDILVSDFVTTFLIFLRVATLIFIAPVFGDKNFPVIAKLGLALVISYMIFFTVEEYPFNYDQGLLGLGLAGVKEAITGMIMGFVLHFVFYGIGYAGTLIGFDMGLGMAQMFDPTSEINNNMIGVFLSMLAILVFLLIDGHHYVVQSLAYSFKVIPIGTSTMNESVFNLIIKYSGGIFVLAVKIASPIMVSFFLLHVAAGIMARVIPQMQVFFVLHPLKIGLGFLLLLMVIPMYIYVFKNLLMGYEDKLLELVKVMSN